MEIEITSFSNEAVAQAGFACGDADLDDFLRSDAGRLEERGVVRTYLAWREDELVGYVSLIADAVELQTIERKRLWLVHGDHPVIPAVKVARLAVSETQRAGYRGTGEMLMAFAYAKALVVSGLVGCRLLTVDAYAAAVTFYERLGFARNKKQKREDPDAPVSMRLDIASPEPPMWINASVRRRDPAGSDV